MLIRSACVPFGLFELTVVLVDWVYFGGLRELPTSGVMWRWVQWVCGGVTKTRLSVQRALRCKGLGLYWGLLAYGGASLFIMAFAPA